MIVRKYFIHPLAFCLLIASSQHLSADASDQQMQLATDLSFKTLKLRSLCAEQLAQEYRGTNIRPIRKLFNALYKAGILAAEIGFTAYGVYRIADNIGLTQAYDGEPYQVNSPTPSDFDDIHSYSSENNYSSEFKQEGKHKNHASNSKTELSPATKATLKTSLFVSTIVVALFAADYWLLPWFAKRQWNKENFSGTRWVLSRVEVEPSLIKTESLLTSYKDELNSDTPINITGYALEMLESFRKDFLSTLIAQRFITGTILDKNTLAEQTIETQLKNLETFRTINSSFYDIAGKGFAEKVNQVMHLASAQNPTTYLRLLALVYDRMVNT